MKKFCLVLLALVCLQGVSCAKGNKNLPVKELVVSTASGQSVVVSAEIARTREERATGLMYRKRLPDGRGMLFVFERDEVLSFWMKNTFVPLSIAYIDYKGEIKDILDMTPHSEQSVKSTGYVRYALEVPQGWFAKNGISVGDFVDLNF